MQPSRSGRYHFGPFCLDLRAHVLLREGQRISVQEQPFQILLALLERPGEVVSREDLRLRLWGEETFVDFDQSMNSAVRRLRVALGDSSKAPAYIETVPRLGFRFLAPVHAEMPVAEMPDTAELPPVVEETPERIQPEPRLETGRAGGSFFPGMTWLQSGYWAAFAGCLAILLLLVLLLVSRSARPVQAQGGPRGSADRSRPVLREGGKPGAGGGAAALSQNTLQAALRRDTDAGTDAEASLDRPSPPLPVSPVAVRGTVLSGRPMSFQVDSADSANLEGTYLLAQRSLECLRQAHAAFERALRIDPGSTSAMVGLARADVLLALDGDHPDARIRTAMDLAERALKLDPSLASAHGVAGATAALKNWNWPVASEQFGRALALDPNDSLGHLWYAMFLLIPQKKYPQAEHEIKAAIQLDPFSLITHTDLGWVYFNEGNFKAAREQYSFVLKMNPKFEPAQFRMGQLRSAAETPGAATAHVSDAASPSASGAGENASLTRVADPCARLDTLVALGSEDVMPLVKSEWSTTV